MGLGNLSTALRVARSVIAGRSGLYLLVGHGLLQAIFPAVGFLLAESNSPWPGQARLATALVLVLAGVEEAALTKAFTARRASQRDKRRRSCLTVALLSSLVRNLTLGFAVGLLAVPLMLAGGIIVTAGAFVSLAGTEVWRGLGRRGERGIALGSALGMLLLAGALL